MYVPKIKQDIIPGELSLVPIPSMYHPCYDPVKLKEINEKYFCGKFIKQNVWHMHESSLNNSNANKIILCPFGVNQAIHISIPLQYIWILIPQGFPLQSL